jgi:hypothetical protein
MRYACGVRELFSFPNARRVGAAQLLYGSDRPVIEPIATGREAMLQANGADLFARIAVAG